MPSLARFLTVICLLAAVGFAAVYSLANFVTPRTREMVVTIPAARLKAPPAETAQNPKTAGAEAAAGSPTATR